MPYIVIDEGSIPCSNFFSHRTPNSISFSVTTFALLNPHLHETWLHESSVWFISGLSEVELLGQTTDSRKALLSGSILMDTVICSFPCLWQFIPCKSLIGVSLSEPHTSVTTLDCITVPLTANHFQLLVSRQRIAYYTTLSWYKIIGDPQRSETTFKTTISIATHILSCTKQNLCV